MTPEQTPRKFFDIAHPGSKAPPATSRPVIAPKQTVTQDPMFHEQAQAPLATPISRPKKVAQPELPKVRDDPVKTEALDATALLIQAGDFVPPKASKVAGQRIVVTVLVIMLAAVAAASYLVVSSM